MILIKIFVQFDPSFIMFGVRKIFVQMNFLLKGQNILQDEEEMCYRLKQACKQASAELDCTKVITL